MAKDDLRRLEPDDDVDRARDDHENPGLPSAPIRWSGDVPLL